MASKKIGCPLSSIFQQWTAQSQRQEVDAESLPSSSSLSYRIVLQTSYSLTTRITAAEPVENPHLYKRAGLATPPERAIRDIHGAGETAWLLRLVELATKQQQRQKGSDNDSVSVIFLTTKSRSQNYSLIDELPQDARSKVQVLDLGSRDPFGWDEEEKTSGDGNEASSTLVNIMNLQEVYQRLKMEFDSRKSVILVWQSLTPLIVVHGFKKVLRLLCALPPCLQIWPVNTQMMNPAQHSQLEDASNAILQLQGGEMNIIRQGIRERGNVLRQKLPFQLEAIATDRDAGQRYRILQESEEEERKNEGDGEDHNGKPVNEERDAYGSKVTTATETPTNKEISRSDGRSRGTSLRIEENDGGRNESTSGNLSSEKEPAPSRPRIYLQDDDPEFDDFDEEDPDDDLDI